MPIRQKGPAKESPLDDSHSGHDSTAGGSVLKNITKAKRSPFVTGPTRCGFSHPDEKSIACPRVGEIVCTDDNAPGGGEVTTCTELSSGVGRPKVRSPPSKSAFGER
eukprot:scaffold190021_cov28-Tisochrysis_lutea.AAC.2